MLPAKRKHDPVRQSVHVACPVEDAFRLFTKGFGEWWPLVSYSLTGADAKECELEPWTGGRVLERTVSGEEHEWGSILTWDPPERLHLSWHPGGREDRRQTVEIEFAVEAQGTRVTVTHTGWERTGAAVCTLVQDSTEMWSALLRQDFPVFVLENMLVLA